MGSDTPQGAWMREYERLRSDLYNAAYDVGDARNGEEEERAEAVAAMARKALDAHVRGLVEERDYLLDRATRTGKIWFGHERDTGISSNAMVRYALTGIEPNKSDYPHDPSDLRSCINARAKAPAHLHERMDALLAKYRAHVAKDYPDDVAALTTPKDTP